MSYTKGKLYVAGEIVNRTINGTACKWHEGAIMAGGTQIAEVYGENKAEAEANAQRIVHIWNNFDNLLKKLKALLFEAEFNMLPSLKAYQIKENGFENTTLNAIYENVFDKAKAAIDLAEKKIKPVLSV